MDLRAGTPMRDIPVDAVFVGSCTNGRIEDLRVVADVLRDHTVADGVRMLIVPDRCGFGRSRIRRAGRDLHGGRGRVAAGRVLDVPGHEPRSVVARAALRVDVEPEFPKAGRARAVARIWCPRPSPPPPRCGADCPLRPTSTDQSRGGDHDGSVSHPYRHRRPVAPIECRHRPNHSSGLLKRVTRTGFEDGLFAAWRNDPSFILNLSPFDRGSVLVAGPISAPVHLGSMPSGRSWTTDSGW